MTIAQIHAPTLEPSVAAALADAPGRARDRESPSPKVATLAILPNVTRIVHLPDVIGPASCQTKSPVSNTNAIWRRFVSYTFARLQ
jgi:hypothetical protein